MTPVEKQELSEIDICDLFITPAIKDAGWDQLTQIRREVTLTPGPVVVRGNLSSRNKKKKKFADYVLQWKAGVPIAIVEAKDNNHTVSHGIQQALGYAEILDLPSAFSSNGDAFASHNKVPESSLDTHDTLVATLLSALTTATADASQFAQAWQRIQANFDTLFTTESSIDQLKQTILQLAVMGKLVPQDPEDEPADKLLKRISVEREKLIEDGKLKGQKRPTKSPFGEAEKPVPSGWVQGQFGDVVYNRDSERVPLSVDSRKTRQGDFDYYGASGVIDSIDDYLFDKPLLLIGEDGANLINRSTPIAFMARGKYWVNNHAHVLDGISETLLHYVCLHINAITLEPYVTGTAQPKMNQAKMNSIPLAIPPENEQHRIVAKVDELMALCDELKASLATAQATQLNLADSLFEQAIG